MTGADLVCVLTEWAEFRNADPVALGELVAGRKVIDGRNCLDPALWTGRLGVPRHGPPLTDPTSTGRPRSTPP